MPMNLCIKHRHAMATAVLAIAATLPAVASAQDWGPRWLSPGRLLGAQTVSSPAVGRLAGQLEVRVVLRVTAGCLHATGEVPQVSCGDPAQASRMQLRSVESSAVSNPISKPAAAPLGLFVEY